jgi:hypothetical protein
LEHCQWALESVIVAAHLANTSLAIPTQKNQKEIAHQFVIGPR